MHSTLLSHFDADFIAISEHWLHDYNRFEIHHLSADYRFVATSSPCEEDAVYCAPCILRGHGGVTLGSKLKWDQPVSPLCSIFTSHMVGVEVKFPQRCLFNISVYLPSRTGCTDDF